MGISTVKLVHGGCRIFFGISNTCVIRHAPSWGLLISAGGGQGIRWALEVCGRGVSGGTWAGEEGGDSMRTVEYPGRAPPGGESDKEGQLGLDASEGWPRLWGH